MRPGRPLDSCRVTPPQRRPRAGVWPYQMGDEKMTYDIESKLRAYLTDLEWDQRDIATVVQAASRCETIQDAQQCATDWLRYKSQT